MRKIRTVDAIRSLVPDAQVVVNGSGDDEIIEWHNPKYAPVTVQQIKTEYQRLSSLPNINPISDRQFFQQAAISGIITNEDALAAVKTGYIPPIMQSVIDAITDADAKFSAQMLVSGSTVFNRTHPLTSYIGLSLGMSEEDIDEFFKQAASL